MPSSPSPAPGRPPAAARRIHTPALSEQPAALAAGWLTCSYLLAQRGAIDMGIAAPCKKTLRELLDGLCDADALGLLERDNRCDLEGHVLYLVTERIRVGRLPGPLLAAGVDPDLLEELAATAGLTDVVFVPRTAECLATYLARHPDSAAIVLREESGDASAAARENEAAARWYDERYDEIAHGLLRSTSRPQYLGGDLSPRRCRYCGRTDPETSFRDKAHAFPEQIGNKALIDRRECDACNRHFARMVEDDYAKWTLPMRATGRVTGKGLPSFKSRDHQMRIDARGPRNLAIRLGEKDPRHRLDEETRTVTLQLERQPYVPMGVFKCLVKMALAVMPEPEAGECDHLKRWILAPAHTFESYPFRPLRLLEQFLPGPMPNDQFQYALLRRRPGHADCPYLIFVLQFSNVLHQIVLPMHDQDRALIEQGHCEVPFFPHIGGTAGHVLAYGRSQARVRDLSGTAAVSGEQQSLSFRYAQRIDQPPPPAPAPA